jgi:hypothetical protein
MTVHDDLASRVPGGRGRRGGRLVRVQRRDGPAAGNRQERRRNRPQRDAFGLGHRQRTATSKSGKDTDDAAAGPGARAT